MSIRALNWAWGQPVDRPADRLVLLCLADHADDRWLCWPAQETIAEAAMCSPDTVQRAISRLEKRGLIACTKRGKAGGGRTSNLYRLNAPGIEPLTPPLSRKMRSNVKPHSCAVINDRTAVRQEPSSRTLDRPKPPEQDAAKIAIDIALKRGPSPNIDRKLLESARGLGVPVEMIEAGIQGPNVSNPSGLFRSHCAKWICGQLPKLHPSIASSALAGRGQHYQTVLNLMTMRQAVR